MAKTASDVLAVVLLQRETGAHAPHDTRHTHDCGRVSDPHGLTRQRAQPRKLQRR
jgi:hypothetical protein